MIESGRPVHDTRILAATDDDFAAMLAGAAFVRPGLVPAPSGVDVPAVLVHIRAMAADLERAGFPGRHWLVAAGDEVVGLCGFKAPPADGEVEIGYGITASRRRRGHATAAVGLMIEAARLDRRIRSIAALTAVDNVASQRVLAANGFENAGKQLDPDDGPVIVWRNVL